MKIVMDKKQELKMSLLERFAHMDDAVGFCRKAYEFLTEDDGDSMSPVFVGSDGVYLVYEDGRYCSFPETCEKEGVAYIGIIHDGHPFGVSLSENGDFRLFRDDFNCQPESELYIRRECDARNEWQADRSTLHITEYSPGLCLGIGEFVPTLAMVAAMFYWADKGLNAALELAGGEPFNVGGLYLSSTEIDPDQLWAYRSAYDESVTLVDKNTPGSLRTVVDFPVAELKRV